VPTKVIVCVNYRWNSQPSCAAAGSEAVAAAFEQAAADGRELAVERVRCLGHCSQGPNVKLLPQGRFLHRVRVEDVPEILEITVG